MLHVLKAVGAVGLQQWRVVLLDLEAARLVGVFCCMFARHRIAILIHRADGLCVEAAVLEQVELAHADAALLKHPLQRLLRPDRHTLVQVLRVAASRQEPLQRLLLNAHVHSGALGRFGSPTLNLHAADCAKQHARANTSTLLAGVTTMMSEWHSSRDHRLVLGGAGADAALKPLVDELRRREHLLRHDHAGDVL